MATDLITKLEEAGEGSRELDGAVWYAVHEPDVEHGCLHVEQTEQGPMEVLTCELGSKYADCVGHYTTSLDAVLALAERVLPGWHVTTSTHRCLLCEFGGTRADLGPANATVSQQMDDLGNYDGETAAHAHASTPALALCAAILRASEEKQS